MERNSFHFSSLENVEFLEATLDSKYSILFSKTAIFLISSFISMLKFAEEYHFKSNTFDILWSKEKDLFNLISYEKRNNENIKEILVRINSLII